MQRKAFRLSAVRPTMTSGGETRVLINKATLTNPQRRLSFFIRDASVIFTAFAERTRNITEILCETRGGRRRKKVFRKAENYGLFIVAIYFFVTRQTN